MGDVGGLEVPKEGEGDVSLKSDNPSFQDLIQNKGWVNADDVLKGYSELESVLGDRDSYYKIPSKEDVDGYNNLYSKLGRPLDPNGYELELTEAGKSDKEGVEWFTSTAHKLGFSQDQTQGLLKSFVERETSEGEKHQASLKEARGLGIKEMEKEWGAEYKSNLESAYRAGKTLFDLDNEGVDRLSDEVGIKTLLTGLAKASEAMSEGRLVDSSRDGHSGGISPEQAFQEMEDLCEDPEFSKLYIEGNKEAVTKYNDLMKIRFGSK